MMAEPCRHHADPRGLLPFSPRVMGCPERHEKQWQTSPPAWARGHNFPCCRMSKGLFVLFN